MTSCGGTFSVTVRRSTLTILSMIGISRKRPGPFGGEFRRPSRKMTPRSYSRATRTADERTKSRMIATAARAMSAPTRVILRRRAYFEHETVHALDADLVAGRDRPVRGPRLPELAADEDRA